MAKTKAKTMVLYFKYKICMFYSNILCSLALRNQIQQLCLSTSRPFSENSTQFSFHCLLLTRANSCIENMLCKYDEGDERAKNQSNYDRCNRQSKRQFLRFQLAIYVVIWDLDVRIQQFKMVRRYFQFAKWIKEKPNRFKAQSFVFHRRRWIFHDVAKELCLLEHINNTVCTVYDIYTFYSFDFVHPGASFLYISLFCRQNTSFSSYTLRKCLHFHFCSQKCETFCE